ncbi:Bax inhibitor-1/YccA family protein [Actinocrispum wychmicini]|uniref:Putative YccA/Bax inhibitor family protein n=1 Tax=Actinocrispum wychmicini TaxID=1213861 RepID=A0A4R2JFG1_9PSEU|nr:Bax inhibitor-1/YccA family protein [Actinocrispum wychmicini]TCO58481.1 putative YccA/Bax inhibitor family protein [Actinocrispum wychmicini]
MRSSSNPAFRNLSGRGGAGYAGFGNPQAGMPPQYGGGNTYQAPPSEADRPITVDDVVMKTAMTLGVALLTGIITAIMVLNGSISPYPPLIIGLLVGLVTSLIVIFRQTPNPALILTYSAAEGVFLGALTGVLESFKATQGIGLQALLGTGLVFGIMLVVYRTGAVKVTPKLTKWIIGAAGGAILLMMLNLVLSLFGVNMGIRGAGPLAIIFSLVVIGIAAFMLLLDFDQADQMIRQGMAAKWAWYAAFGLMTTLVWLYLEILRLLWALNER